MQLSGNTVLITGGGSGIGRGIAEALQKAGSTVIIAGRRKKLLEEVAAANPGMKYVELNIEDPENVREVAAKLVQDYPELNVVFNNAGVMKTTIAGNGPIDDADLLSIVTTNLLGPIRLTGALLDHLKKQPQAAVITTTSGLAFVPMAPAAVYCATKAAMHSYTLSLRFDLRGTSVKAIELVPPYVQTEIYGDSANDPRAMPLKEFIDETIKLLGTDTEEIRVERVKNLRPDADFEKEAPLVTQFNEMMAGGSH